MLETCAYNILGSREDARDAVQDIYIKVLDKPADHIEDQKAYLVRSVVNHAINMKNRQEFLRRKYKGPWLPEPVETGHTDDALLQKDILSYSLMVLLEKLTAGERAVFILKEAFGYSHGEIGEVLEISAANSRQLLRRAKLSLKNPPGNGKQLTAFRPDQFLSAIQNREMEKLEELLSEDIVITSDGGGKVLANRIPVKGKQRAIKYLFGVYEKYQKGLRFLPAVINHQPAFLHYQGNVLVSCQVFLVNESGIRDIYFIRNPEKLKDIRKSG